MKNNYTFQLVPGKKYKFCFTNFICLLYPLYLKIYFKYLTLKPAYISGVINNCCKCWIPQILDISGIFNLGHAIISILQTLGQHVNVNTTRANESSEIISLSYFMEFNCVHCPWIFILPIFCKVDPGIHNFHGEDFLFLFICFV